MPVSKKRKRKNGKKVRMGRTWSREEIEEVNRPAGVSLQDLINVVAAQDFKKDPEAYAKKHPEVKLADDVKVHIPEEVPVTIGEGEDKHEVGTATQIPGDEEHLSIQITDPEVLKAIQGPIGDFSIEKENEDGR